MITIGQLARYAACAIKTIRVYHDKGLLPEPDRDSSGYRRYTAQHAIDLIKIRTFAEAGVPLARIRELRAASDEDFREALHHVDTDLTARIRGLRETQRRLRRLAAGRLQTLLPEVGSHLDQLPELGFSPRWVALETDLWILVFATHPDTAIELFHDQAQALTDPRYVSSTSTTTAPTTSTRTTPALTTSPGASSVRPANATDPVIFPDRTPALRSRH